MQSRNSSGVRRADTAPHTIPFAVIFAIAVVAVAAPAAFRVWQLLHHLGAALGSL